MSLLRLLRARNKRCFCCLLLGVLLLILIYTQLLTDEFFARSGVHGEVKSCDHHEPIDVVYTWVNGSETRFQTELKTYERLTKDIKAESLSAKRFDDKDELRYSLRSVAKHMPWVRHVYIVTNGQIPSWLDMDAAHVTLVTHAEIFDDPAVLPTFSSPAIEANLHRIPGISERFIYFNDDVFLMADVYPEDFYTPGRGCKIYTAWPMQDCAYNCQWTMLGDGQCDHECFNADCEYDAGDCDVAATDTTAHAPLDAVLFDVLLTNGSGSGVQVGNADRLEERVRRFNAAKIMDAKRRRVLRRNRRERHLSGWRRLQALQSTPITISNQTLALVNLTMRHNLNKDLFSASLLFTQRTLSARYGYAQRRVIAHAPIMIDVNIMRHVQSVFASEFQATIRRRFRAENDLQIAFVYSHFMRAASVEKSMDEIFDEYDTDRSGTWSDREIHTLLTRLYQLPLTYEKVTDFQYAILNCSNALSAIELEAELRLSTPEYERYVDSLLNLATRKVIVECASLRERLMRHHSIATRALYRHQVVAGADDVSFNMLRSAPALAMHMLNQIRRDAKKFVCINDDLDRGNASRADNELLVALLQDFFVSLFPQRSRFELPPTFRNRFARMDDLRRWRVEVAGGDNVDDFLTSYIVTLFAIIMIIIAVLLVFYCCRRLRLRIMYRMRL